jgi:hypothetical protein
VPASRAPRAAIRARRRRAPRRSPLAARALTGPLGFLVAGVLDVALAWGGWGLRELAGRLARRAGR